MAEEFGINVVGIEETCAALTRLPARVVKHAYAKALAAAAVPVVRELLPRVPQLTGKLAASQVTVINVDAQGKGGIAQIGFGKQGYVARLIEYGHRIIGHRPRKVNTGKTVPAKPFMRPAAQAAATESVEAFRDSLLESIAQGIPEDL